MIRSFGCKETEKIWEGPVSRRLPRRHSEPGFAKAPVGCRYDFGRSEKPAPSNHLEYLKGSRKGQLSIRINNQWRICFRWRDGEATEG